MKPDLCRLRVSSVGVALFVVSYGRGHRACGAAAEPGAAAWSSCLIGLYLLFAIRVADQWEKVAVLRFGKFIGLRGPGCST